MATLTADGRHCANNKNTFHHKDRNKEQQKIIVNILNVFKKTKYKYYWNITVWIYMYYDVLHTQNKIKAIKRCWVCDEFAEFVSLSLTLPPASGLQTEETPEKRPRTDEAEGSSSSVGDGDEEEEETRGTPKQKNRRRCYRCQTKLELVQQELGSCRCGE